VILFFSSKKTLISNTDENIGVFITSSKTAVAAVAVAAAAAASTTVCLS
jgi:hypothetical protein